MAALISHLSYGQGTVRGKITDDLGETVIGATITFKNDPSVGAITDFNGEFSIKIPTSDPTTLVISFIGFEKIEKTVTLQNNEVVVLNIDFKPTDFGLSEVVIEGRANKAGDYYMEKIKKNSATSIDYLSNETMRRIGDNQVSAAIQRIPGVSTVGNTFTVRGLADRYLVTTVNGMDIPTLDPFTNNINLDVFPSGLVDNVIITKTGSPELQGDWSGAFVSLETKDFPEEFFLEVETSIGINSNATFNEITSSRRSDTDWLGWDNGFRDVPDGVPLEQDQFPSPVNSPFNIYDEYTQLGLQPFLNSFGITQNTPINPGDALSQLGLIELGFLAPALFGNEAAVNNALGLYNEAYGDEYFFPIFNERLSEIGQSFNNHWFTIKQPAPINSRFSMTIGNQTKLFGKPFGFVAGFRHSRVIQSSTEGEINRTVKGPAFDPNEDPENAVAVLDLNVEASQETSNLSALFSGSLKLNANNQIKLVFMPNWLGENNARFSLGFDQSNPETIVRDDQFYQERRHLIYQFHSDHYLPNIASKINFDVSYTDGKRNEPDFILLQYNYLGDTLFAFENTERPTRSYREMDDDLFHTKAAIEIPFHKDMRSLGKMTFGGSYLNNRRQNIETQFVVTGVGGSVITDRNTALDVSRFSAEGRTSFDLYYVNNATELDRDIGIKQVYAAFAMADYHFTTRLRAMGGVRLEYTDMIADIYDYWKRNLPSDSPERRNIGGVKASGAEINQLDVLPCISFIYRLKEKEETPMNLRLNYFRSLARPSFRELSPIALDDFILQGTVQGNAALETVSVDNYDIRLESYFPGNNNVSVSVFYKNFIDHIELIERFPDFFSWANADESYTLGFELEGQYSILQNLVFRANLSLIQSLTTISEPVQIQRPMFGQAPYIINGSLTHTLDKFRLQYTVSYNLQGPKIAIVSNENVTPNVFEIPRHQIDIKVGKKLGEHFNASVSVRDLLNMPVRRAFEFDSGFDVLNFDSFRWGTTYSLSLTYTI